MKALNLLLEITIYSWFLFAAIMLIKKLINKHSSPTLQYLIWFLFIARLCIPITFDSSIRLFVIPKPHILEEQRVDIAKPSPGADTIDEITPKEITSVYQKNRGDNALKEYESPPSNRQSPIPSDIPKGKTSIEINWYQVVMGLWLTGIAGVLSFFIGTSFEMNKKIKNSTIVPSDKLRTMVDYCRKELHIKKPIAIYVIEDITTPALTVSWRPKLLFPADMLETTEDEKVLFAVRHELTHFKGRDHLVSLLLRFLEALYWFNPVVWITSKKIIMDMELACDSRVVKDMKKAEKAHYASTILGMFSENKKPQFVLGMAMGGTRDIAEKRIRGIYTKGRTKPRVRLLVTVLSVALIFSCFTTACQPTPKEPVVIGKGDGKLEKIIQSKPDTREDENRQPNITRHTDSFQGADEKVTINIDADVVVPTGNMPVVEVKPRYIDMEQVKAMAKVLFHGNTAYEPMVALSKDDLEEEILKLKKFTSSEEAMLEYYGGEQTIVDEVKVEFEERIAQYEKLYDDAPDTAEIRETDWTFRPRAYYEDMVIFGNNLDEDNDESRDLKKYYYDSEMITLDSKVLDYDARMTVFNQDNTKHITHYAYFNTGSSFTGDNTPYWDETDSQPMTMTREEAISMVQDALDQMGITNMELSSCHASGKPQPSSMLSDPGLSKEAANLAAAAGEGRDMDERDADEKGEDVYGYHITFTPVFEGAAVHDMTFFDYHWDAGINQYAQTYQYEKLNVTVQRETITSFDWVAPMEQVRVENENVPMLSLEDATETFKKQMQLEYTIGKLSRYAPDSEEYEEAINNIESGEIHITDISLGLMRMRVKDRPGAYRMVPAWVFLGYEQLYGKGPYSDSEMGEPMSNMPYMVINAVDGSIMDASQGY